jgi:tripartite-type tricarboxylate transporter receptor subunit TctC
MLLLLSRTQTIAEHVPYRGGAPAMQAVLAGDVAAYFGNPSDIIPHLDGAAIRVLGVAGAERLAVMPNVPTIAEQGFPGFRAETWNGIAAPAGVPEAVLSRMVATLRIACADIAFRASLERLGTVPVCSTPEQFRHTMEAETLQWAELVRTTGIKLE